MSGLKAHHVRRLGMIGAGVGAMAGLLIAIATPVLVRGMGSLVLDSTAVGRAALDDLELVIGQVGGALESTSDTLESVEGIVADGAVDLSNVSAAGSALAEVVTVSVPAALDSVRQSLPALEDTARVLDRTMRALSFVGVDYDTEVRLDDAIANVEAELAPIPATLRDQAQRFEETTTAINDLATSALGVSSRLDEVGASLRDVADTLTRADDTAGAAREIMDRLDRRVSVATRLGSLVAVVAGLGVALSQASLWWVLRESPSVPGG